MKFRTLEDYTINNIPNYRQMNHTSVSIEIYLWENYSAYTCCIRKPPSNECFYFLESRESRKCNAHAIPFPVPFVC